MNSDISVTMHVMRVTFSECDLNVLLQGSVSQIFYLGLKPLLHYTFLGLHWVKKRNAIHVGHTLNWFITKKPMTFCEKSA